MKLTGQTQKGDILNGRTEARIRVIAKEGKE